MATQSPFARFAPNQGLAALSGMGRFRGDLCYRLKAVELSLALLRKRWGDMLMLAEHCLRAIRAAKTAFIGKKKAMQTIEANVTENDVLGRVVTTLYDLTTAIQQAAASGNNAEVVATLLYMMDTGHMRWAKAGSHLRLKGKDSPVIPPPYIIDYGGSEDSLSIRSTSARGKEAWLYNDTDYALLYHLCYMEKHRMRSQLSKYEVCDLYRCQLSELGQDSKTIIAQRADSCVNSFRRRMRGLGINPHRLLIPVRGIGWKLHPEVHFIQFPSEYPPSESREVYRQNMLDHVRHPSLYPGEEP